MTLSTLGTPLLSAIRSEKQRRKAPAVRALRHANQDRLFEEAHPAVWRQVRNHLGEVHRAAKIWLAFVYLSNGSFILPASGHKMDEVRSELLHAGIAAESISNLRHESNAILGFSSAVQYLMAFFAAVLTRVVIIFRVRNPTKEYLNLIYGFAWQRKCIQSCSASGHWIIIGDLSPFLISLAAALRSENQRVGSWQYGYQDFKRFPIRPDLAFVLNRRGLELARVDDQLARIPVFQRKTNRPVPVRFPDKRKGAVGIILNAFSKPDVFKTIVQIQKHLGREVAVRPHPRDAEFGSRIASSDIEICRDGSLHQFCEKVDWVICGNSTAALKILGCGFPVCQFFGFDLFFDDHFQYQKMGLMPIFTTVSQITEKRIQEFYTEHVPSVLLDELFGQRPLIGVKPLSEIRTYLESSVESIRSKKQRNFNRPEENAAKVNHAEEY